MIAIAQPIAVNDTASAREVGTTSARVVGTTATVQNSSFCGKFLPFSVRLPCHTEKSTSYSFHSPLFPF